MFPLHSQSYSIINLVLGHYIECYITGLLGMTGGLGYILCLVPGSGHYIDVFIQFPSLYWPVISLFRPIRVTILENFRIVRGLILNSSAFPGNSFKMPLREFLFLNFTRNTKWDLRTEVGGEKLGDGIDIYYVLILYSEIRHYYDLLIRREQILEIDKYFVSCSILRWFGKVLDDFTIQMPSQNTPKTDPIILVPFYSLNRCLRQEKPSSIGNLVQIHR